VGGGLTIITFGNHAVVQKISLSTSGQLRSAVILLEQRLESYHNFIRPLV